MFVIAIGFEDEAQILEVPTFQQMWEIKEDFESHGFDVLWEYEP